MALLSLGENRWRMLRRVLKKRQFRFEDARNMTRHDRVQFDWMVEYGLFAVAGDGVYAVTDQGRAAAELGMYDWEPAGGEAVTVVGQSVLTDPVAQAPYVKPPSACCVLTRISWANSSKPSLGGGAR